MKKSILFLFLGLLAHDSVFSQVVNTATADTTGGEHIGKISIAGYVDAYYGYGLNKISANSIPIFVSSSRHNEINVNLTYLDFRYHSKSVRARIMPAFGTHMVANYANEPIGYKNLLEANGGVRLFPKKDIWLDVGIIGSPYTNESAISKDHLMYTRSLAPEFVPYYQAGAKLTVPLSPKINLVLYALNGWQQIIDLNNQKSFGSQLEFKPNDHNLFNWDTYIGNERTPFTPNYRIRYFTDLYWIRDTHKKFSSTMCAYFGIQEVEDNQIYSNHKWWQINGILKYKVTEKMAISARVEYFNDPDNIMISTLNNNPGFNCFSSSMGLSYHFNDHAMFRFEARNFLTKEYNFQTIDGVNCNYLNWLVSNLTIWF